MPLDCNGSVHANYGEMEFCWNSCHTRPCYSVWDLNAGLKEHFIKKARLKIKCHDWMSCTCHDRKKKDFIEKKCEFLEWMSVEVRWEKHTVIDLVVWNGSPITSPTIHDSNLFGGFIRAKIGRKWMSHVAIARMLLQNGIMVLAWLIKKIALNLAK